MQSTTDATTLTIIVSTATLLSLCVAIIYFLFLYQRKRFRHQHELMEIREAYNQALFQSKLAIQEQTLDHISKELHANFSHLVSLININLSEILPGIPDSQRDNVIETKSLAKQLMSDLKALSANLNTDHIMHIGFVKALENELKRLEKTRKFEITFTQTGDVYRLSAEHEIILFRLCQEVLNNVVKYSRATAITTSLSFLPDHLLLCITDNGIGFDVEHALNRSGEKQSTGLLNIQKRATLINANFSISSHTGRGTQVMINIPSPETKTLSII